ncbi:3-hydroxybutyrate dehydrogenase [Microvirga tunisiensis]|uniref:3-hydroxybutyrate dehydrogenase n=1 Tax=Microvirga tunisiensis TaxID=2108360 RepID=A0A5N7MFV9_9HYPH|nr:3-hydroxybutyrate dehydrogenase [Microvirga tunisiensis]MPR07322.1 3-hydroxybutyrate dehydrogenase [Microvirga tunisiensis]MPR25683.1 3-hydroxybutyrate dehydrogenase [Microvirga tunisiensis]
MHIPLPQPAVGTAKILDGRVALVTGSTSGIGLGIARAFAFAGASVVINGFGKPEEINDTIEGLQKETGATAVYSAADMTKPDEIAVMVNLALETFGRLDILVNNAGIFHVGPIDQVSAEKWDAVVAINLSSAFHTIRVALPAMRRQGGGRIINIASALALVGSPLTSAYTAAKHGIIGLTKVVALETAEQNITCNAICPGNVWTPLAEAHLAEQVKTGGLPREQVIRNVLLAEQPNKRFAMVEEIGAFATFLASDAAASITGAALPIDGGWTAH